MYKNAEIPLPSIALLTETEYDPHSLRLLKDFTMLGVEFTKNEINTAIRAYYGSISNIDQLISQLFCGLKNNGMDQNTVVIFTFYHGEMLGERSMWLKKHFFAKSMLIPLVVNSP